MAAVRRATVKWNGDLDTGDGQVSATTSRAFSALPVTWASRTEHADGKTSPEELLAAAHASCFSMAFASELAKAGSPADRLEVTSEVTFDRVDGKWSVISSKLTVRGRVTGFDNDRFRTIAEQAKDACPISRALVGNVVLSVDAALG
ncbi:MAG: OsmC family peroxiredoxin [Candidatus Limnocylindrales bacterium]